MNEFQKLLCEQYGGGDYAYILEKPELWESEARVAGDTLFLFLMIELSDDGDEKMDLDTALSRVRIARDDVELVLTLLQNRAAREDDDERSTRCQHRNTGRDVCADCGAAL